MAARRLMRQFKPLAVVGFGGYPTVPPLLAAAQANIPTILHEQNAVMGRANRFLSARASAIATGFPDLTLFDARLRDKLTHVGNPMRPMVIEAAKLPAPVLARLNAAAVKSITQPDTRAKMEANGAIVVAGTAESFAEALRSGLDSTRKYVEQIKARGVKFE